MNELFDQLFVFELANNHQGSVSHGRRIIDEVAKISRRRGIKAAVKLQYRELDTFIHPDYQNRRDVPHVPRFVETRLSANDFQVLVESIRENGLISMCTPFDEASVGQIQDHGIQIIKVASCSANDWPLLTRIASANKPVICSTGGRSLHEIDNIVSFFEHRDVEFSLLHCVGIYPSPNDTIQLDFMTRLKRRYPYVAVGYSGHEAPDNYDVVKAAVAMGASILERHVGVPTDTVALNKYSMDPAQADKWVASAIEIRKITGCGHGASEKHVPQEEIDSLRSLARGTYAKRAISKGSTVTAEDVFFAMPCQDQQTTSGEFQDPMVASKDYAPNEPLSERRPLSVISTIRNVVHDAKGILYEANVDFGKQFSIELSHHYGMEHFRQSGALIVTVVNREYCKKLVVVLPGQHHPTHAHKIKEETFHMLWGDLSLELNGQIRHLRRGDQVLIERGAKHAFTSKTGAVFEELSTTHVVGDSYYDDARIQSIDPIQRKTYLDSW